MKAKDVTIGGEYMTKVGDGLVRVRVQGVASPSYGSNLQRWNVRRVDTGATLPKPRTAAALRPCPRSVES